MKLTIGMIVKNEEKYLERCLSSIKPILDNVDSELIITDTGSTDRTVEIAKKYTDKVQYFEWINDFSAARNTTIRPAQGEWYMFVDGDDIFESCDDIIHFYNSGEYKKYHSASFIYRSILDLNNYRYNDQYVIRMTERTPETCFVGIIHENLTPLKSPVRMITDIVDHYGYLYDDSENIEKDKAKRNEELLLKELETISENNNKYYYIYNYLFEATALSLPEKAEKYLNYGIEKAIEKKSPAVFPLIMNKVGVLFQRRDFSGLLEMCDTYFTDIKRDNPHYVADAEMYAARSLALENIGRHGDAFDAFSVFFSSFETMKEKKNYDPDIYTTSPVLASDANYLNVVMKYILCCANLEKYNELSVFLKKTDLSSYAYNDVTVANIVENEIALMSSIGYENAANYYSHLDSHGKTVFRNSLCNILFVEKEKRKTEDIIKALRDFSSDDKKLSAKADIYDHYFINKALSEEEILSFAQTFGMEGNHDLLCIMMQCGMDITGLWNIPDFDPIVCVKRCNDYINVFFESAESYDAEYIADVSDLPKAAKIYEFCMKCAVETSRDINGLIRVYAGIGKKYSDTSVTSDIPPEIKAACCFADAEEARKSGNYKICFSEMKKAVEIYPNISPIVSYYNNIITDEYKKESSGSSINAEMKSLALQVKNNIRILIGKGDHASASKLIEEYRKIAPNDPEIDELIKMIM